MATIKPIFTGVSTRSDLRRAATSDRTKAAWWHELLWVAAAAALGFLASAVLAGWLEIDRSWFVLVHTLLTTAFVAAYIRWSAIDVAGMIRRHRQWAIAGGVLVGAVLAATVQQQDGASRAGDAELAFDLLWWGLVYGIVDALLLTVLPVAATWRALSARGWTGSWRGRIGAGAAAIVASLLVTAAYHLGFPEFRGTDIGGPLFGNGLVTLATVLTANPITGLISHIAMHVAAVLHGAEGTTQLPPHY